MNAELDAILAKFLETYPSAKGVMFHSLELPIQRSMGDKTDLLEKYKDIPMMSIDESFTTSFNFIITERGTIIIFFVMKLHFISVFIEGENPNKELASRMLESFKSEFEHLVTILS